MAVVIMTDSACDIPDFVIEQFGLEVIPMGVELDGTLYWDNVTIRPEELMQKMRAGSTAKTTQVTTFRYKEAFERHAERGDSLIYIGFSSGLSGSFSSANIAKTEVLEQYPDFDLTLIDTKCASMGFGLVVYYALKWQQAGLSKEEIIAKTVDCAKRMQHVFTVDDLEYLFRGGRVSRSAAIVGSLLNVKPILDMDDEGKLRPIGKKRGRKSSIKCLADLAGERGRDIDKQLIGISHGDDMEAVEELQGLLREQYGCTEFMVNNLGCAVGAHAGPGTLALFFLN